MDPAAPHIFTKLYSPSHSKGRKHELARIGRQVGLVSFLPNNSLPHHHILSISFRLPPFVPPWENTPSFAMDSPQRPPQMVPLQRWLLPAFRNKLTSFTASIQMPL